MSCSFGSWPGGLHGALVLAYGEKGSRAVDIGDGRECSGLSKGPGGCLPAFWTNPELLGEQSDEDPGLVLAEAGKRLHALEQLVAGRSGRPDRSSVATVILHKQAAEVLHPGSHRAREAMEGRSLDEQGSELV